MECPKCQGYKLQPTKLEQGLTVMGCAKCNGAIVSLLNYRDWLERTDASESEPYLEEYSAEKVIDTPTMLTCPKCKKAMLKYKISGCSGSRLDLCASCDEAWLDDGEWELLKSLELTRQMPSVFTEEWQRKLRKQATEEAREKRLLLVVEQDELDEAKRVRDWLKGHPNKGELMFFINLD
ncbi:MAG: zf-TFIIB domain-containing protein [Pseudomonadales bacterium]|nr:zf-TFIIB domain-containing protein [Pseudomonadales bacterium]